MNRTHRLAGAVALLAMAATVSPVQAQPQVTGTHAVRGGGGYDVIVDGVKRASVPVSDPAYTARATSSSNGSLAAVITDFNGTSGTGLRVVDRSGHSRSVAQGEITSASFSGKGTLAYLSDGFVHVDGKPVGKVSGRAPEIIGWTSDNTGLLVVQHPDVTNEGTYVESLSRFDVTTGAVSSLIESGKTGLYRDFRIVDIKGSRHVSFIEGYDVYRCGSDGNALVLATETGKIVNRALSTSGHYRTAVWDAGGDAVAYELMGCVTDKSAGPGQLDLVNGVYLHSLSAKSAKRIVEGLSYNYGLDTVDGSSVTIGSPNSGYRTVDSVVRAQQLDASGDVTIQARLNRAEHIHQLWDTRNEFNGNSSCGPTSAVIDLVTYQLPTQFGVQVSQPSSHWSKWGLYITDQYAKNGTTFNRTMQDWAGNGNWKGAHGWITGYYCPPPAGHPWRPCASWDSERDYLSRNGAAVSQGTYTPAQVRSYLDQGKFVIMSGTWGNTSGHLSVVIGYTDDGRFYVHDTYGAGTDGSYDGAAVVYTWDYIKPVQMWAA